jgi:hypothetical protein
VLWGVKNEKGLRKGNGGGGRGVGYMEDNKRIREMCNNSISEFNYTEQLHC